MGETSTFLICCCCPNLDEDFFFHVCSGRGYDYFSHQRPFGEGVECVRVRRTLKGRLVFVLWGILFYLSQHPIRPQCPLPLLEF